MWRIVAIMVMVGAPAEVARAAEGQASVSFSADGLTPTSPRGVYFYRNGTRAVTALAGRKTSVAPGTYEVRVGYPSGQVAHEVTLEPGQQYEVPTGLFTFRQITPADAPSTVPQELYHGDTYIATGYQGRTARLSPGVYRVCYQDPADSRPSVAFGPWHVLGVFPNPQTPKPHAGFFVKHPPEDDLIPDLAREYPSGANTLRWLPLEDYPQINLSERIPAWGIAYATAVIESDEARDAQLILTYRGGATVWLNGEHVKTIPPPQRAYAEARMATFVHLKQGKNVLLVKLPRTNTHWPLGAVCVQGRSYTVEVVANEATDASPLPVVTNTVEADNAFRGIVFCQIPDLADGRSGLHPEQFRIIRRPVKARLCSLIPARPDGKLTDLTGDRFLVAMQPDLSYDGTKVIFSGRKTASDPFDIFEMNLDGTGLHQITKDMAECTDPCYLPDGRILFSCGNTGFRDEYDRDPARLLFACKPDGSELDQLTFNLSSDSASIVLDDGRILFTTWQHHGEHQGTAGIFAFGTVNPDGTGFNQFTGNALEANNTKSYARQLTDGRVVFVDSAGHRHYNAGGLSAVSKEKPLTSRTILTPGQIYNGYNLAGRYASPYPLPGGRMICSYSPGRGTSPLTNDPTEEIRMGIYHFDFQAGRPGRFLFDAPDAQDIDPIAIYKRSPPPIIPSFIDKSQSTGTLLCVNPYLSDRKPNNRVIIGQLPPAKPGEIKKVRVLEGFGVKDTDPKRHRGIVIDILQMSFGSGSNGGNAFEQRRIVGEAPCEEDGSFHIEVPADTTLALQMLDANNMAIETQLTWTWVRPGERRLCIGCHEDREMALPNLDCRAMSVQPRFVALPPEERRTVDFRRDIMPVIEKRCATANCHGSETPAGGLDLGGGFDLVFHRKGRTGRTINAALFNQAYESLLDARADRVGRLVTSGAARHSPLIWRLYNEQLAYTDARHPYTTPIKQMPPGTPLPDDEKRLFAEWVDLGAQWDNLPAEDDLPGYNADESVELGRIEAEKVANPIAAAPEAFRTRCTECHDMRCIQAGSKKKSEKDWLGTIDRMDRKRNGWMHDTEKPLITQHILENYFQAKP